MKIYLAPMEGLTGYVVRNAFYHNFDCFDTYFTPFIAAGKSLHKKTIRDVTPENNAGMHLVPQVLSVKSDEVQILADLLAPYGYSELNINFGCPSGTVSSKGRGSGFLQYPDDLDRLLDEIYSQNNYQLSVKTRVGYQNTDEWSRILSIYKKYPRMTELIIHPRTQKDFYRGPVRKDCFDEAYEYFSDSEIPLCFNGDINDTEDFLALMDRYPNLDRIMIGRGAFRRPGLALKIKAMEEASGNYRPASRPLGVAAGCADPLSDPETYRKKLRAFHDEIWNGYLEIFGSPKDALARMKEIWTYLYESFEDSEKLLKKIKKCRDPEEYLLLVDLIFRNLELGEF